MEKGKESVMQFRTEVNAGKADFEIRPAERMLFVGSCFAENLGKRFQENRFPATVNPFGVMYNPASILHTVEKSLDVHPRVAAASLYDILDIVEAASSHGAAVSSR